MTKTKKQSPSKKAPNVTIKLTLWQRFTAFCQQVVASIKRRIAGLLARRPHRSFRRTRRRDYVRPLTLQGYWAFTNHVRKTLMKNKRTFFALIAIYGILSLVLVGLASQANYSTLGDTLRTTGNEIFSGNLSQIGQAGLLLAAGIGGNFSTQLSESQQIYAVILLLLAWLTTVWLLRAQLAGGKPKLREGIYSAGAPIIATFIVLVVAVVQLLPVALAAAGFSAALASGLLDGGVAAMAFWTVAALLLALSLYWITSTLIALVVVTLPGMYPMNAIKIAGDLVVGRRVRILLRFVWLAFTVALGWIVTMVPLILLDAWLKSVLPSLANVPLVPVALLTMTSLTVTWVASYIYLFYRKVVDNDAAPA